MQARALEEQIEGLQSKLSTILRTKQGANENRPSGRSAKALDKPRGQG